MQVWANGKWNNVLAGKLKFNGQLFRNGAFNSPYLTKIVVYSQPVANADAVSVNSGVSMQGDGSIYLYTTHTNRTWTGGSTAPSTGVSGVLRTNELINFTGYSTLVISAKILANGSSDGANRTVAVQIRDSNFNVKVSDTWNTLADMTNASTISHRINVSSTQGNFYIFFTIATYGWGYDQTATTSAWIYEMHLE